MVTTNDEAVAWECRSFRDTATTYNSASACLNRGQAALRPQRVGFNFRLTEVQSILGLHALKRLEREPQARAGLRRVPQPRVSPSSPRSFPCRRTTTASVRTASGCIPGARHREAALHDPRIRRRPGRRGRAMRPVSGPRATRRRPTRNGAASEASTTPSATRAPTRGLWTTRGSTAQRRVVEERTLVLFVLHRLLQWRTSGRW